MRPSLKDMQKFVTDGTGLTEEQAYSAILAIHQYLKSIDCWWIECQECAVGKTFEEDMNTIEGKSAG